MSESEKALREELTQAIEKVRREIDILRSPSTIGAGADSRSVIVDLETELPKR